MKNIKNFMRLVAVVFAAFAMVACVDNKSQASKDNMIPDNAIMAFKVDAAQLWDKAVGEPGSQVALLWDMAKSGISMQASSMGETGELLRKVIEDPSSLGIRLDVPFVLSVSADVEELMYNNMSGDVYYVALLDNKDAFVGFVDALLGYADEEGVTVASKEDVNKNYTYYFLGADEEMSVDMGVSKGSVVLRCHFADLHDPLTMKESMLALFENGGPAKTEGLKNFYASKGVAAIWADIDGIMTQLAPAMEYDEAAAANLKAYLPLYKGASVVSALFLNDGATELTLSAYGSDELKANAIKYNAISSGRFFNQMPNSSLLVLNVAIKDFVGLVDELSNMNESYAETFAMLETEFEINKELMAGFPGVISFALDGRNLGETETPGFSFFMECEKNVWEYVQDLLMEGFEFVGNDTYAVGEYGYITYRDGAIVVADTQTFNGLEKTFADSPLAKQIEKGGMVIDLTVLSADALDSLAESIDEYMTGSDLLQFANSVVLTTSDDHMSATLTVNMGDKEHNILEKLLLESINNAF